MGPERRAAGMSTGCAFCAIASGNASAREVLRTPDVVAFFPTEPAVVGHVLVIPTRHVEAIYDLDMTSARELAVATVQVARAVRDVFSPAGMNIVQSNGEAATQTVPHVHVHVVPREKQDAIGDFWPENGIANGAVLDAARSDLAARLNDGDGR